MFSGHLSAYSGHVHQAAVNAAGFYLIIGLVLESPVVFCMAFGLFVGGAFTGITGVSVSEALLGPVIVGAVIGFIRDSLRHGSSSDESENAGANENDDSSGGLHR